MSPRPQAALLLLFDISSDPIVEHDDWHTREHLRERLALSAAAGKPRPS